MVRTLFLLLLIGALVVWKIATAFPSDRTTIVEDGNPIRVMSWDGERGRLTIIPIPEDVRVQGARGVGELPLASIRRLEALDPSKKGILVATLSEVLAVPIRETVERVPFPLRIRWWWMTSWLRPDAVGTIELASRGVFRPVTLPDGSAVRSFDSNRFDAVIGNELEVERIRRGERRVRVVNTTDVAGLGNRAARFLSRAGMVVVAVDSERMKQARCTAHAKEELWRDPSVTFINDLFGCAVTAEGTEERVDITVRLGADAARR